MTFCMYNSCFYIGKGIIRNNESVVRAQQPLLMRQTGADQASGSYQLTCPITSKKSGVPASEPHFFST